VLAACLSAVVAAACALASIRRLAWAVAPTMLEPATVLDAMSRDPSCSRSLCAGIAARDIPWDSALFAAFAAPSAAARDAIISEQLLELDWRAQRWSRVPRVCASIATSVGFLCASVALMNGLAVPGVDAGTVLGPALDALTAGIAGMSFCVAVHFRSRRVLRERLASVDRLIERLRRTSAEAD
jgi:hypothetical protein